MADDEGEIEYLDEDEDLVQKYVNPAPVLPSTDTLPDVPANFIPEEPLLVERKPKYQKAQDTDDSDYDPSEDLKYMAEERRKKRLASSRKELAKITPYPIKLATQTPGKTIRAYENKLKSLPNLTVKKTFPVKYEPEKPIKKIVKKTPAELLKQRKNLDIKIPDYNDPICLPALVNMTNNHDYQKLLNWNHQCLEQYKKNELETTEKMPKVKSSVKTILFRNVKSKSTGKIETSIWGKTINKLENGESSTSMFQSILPKFRQKTVVRPYSLMTFKGSKNLKQTSEAILTQEKWKDEESLVVYKPRDALSAVYRFVANGLSGEKEMRVLHEKTCTKICAPCYQTSWRGVRKTSGVVDKIRCNVCSRSFVSMSSLLGHLKLSHTAQQVRRCKTMLSKTVAKVVSYHYKCRICQEMFLSIKLLRKHVMNEHKGKEIFTCEVGNHMAS